MGRSQAKIIKSTPESVTIYPSASRPAWPKRFYTAKTLGGRRGFQTLNYLDCIKALAEAKPIYQNAL